MPGVQRPAHTKHRAAIERHAGMARIDPDLVEAIVWQESGGNPYAYNPEPRYPYLWDVRRGEPFRKLTADEVIAKWPPTDFPTLTGDRDQEFWGQQASWGLMQLMGAVARERGFTGPYLTELVDPDVNLQLGCKHLAGLIGWAMGDRWKAVAAFNAGRGGWASGPGQVYVRKIKAHFARVTGARP